jgi:undecaprenyl diphosphate synthase
MTEEEALEAAKAGKLPAHIAVIMDGNGRWAKQRGLSRIEGHHEGRRATKRLVQAAGAVGLPALTVYSFSSENWRRPPEEVQGLMALIEGSLQEELEELHREHVRFVASGRLHELPESLQRTIAAARERTAGNTGLLLNMAVNYGGRTEIVDAARALATHVARGDLAPQEIDEALLAQHLYLPDLPDPDLIIRTGRELRLSNFLLWQAAYAELHVLPILWPEFAKQHLYEAILSYQARERRFGDVTAPQTGR